MFAGKVIAITGASEGIGAELARKRELVMILQAKIGLWLRLPFPGLVDRMVPRALKKD